MPVARFTTEGAAPDLQAKKRVYRSKAPRQLGPFSVGRDREAVSRRASSQRGAPGDETISPLYCKRGLRVVSGRGHDKSGHKSPCGTSRSDSH
jgi:hypothetical protein